MGNLADVMLPLVDGLGQRLIGRLEDQSRSETIVARPRQTWRPGKGWRRQLLGSLSQLPILEARFAWIVLVTWPLLAKTRVRVSERLAHVTSQFQAQPQRARADTRGQPARLAGDGYWLVGSEE